jgi:hypothetical protein
MGQYGGGHYGFLIGHSDWLRINKYCGENRMLKKRMVE